MPTIITENDESQWDDQTGNLYHFPNKYLKYLQPGTPVIYYKGKIKDLQYRAQRLSDAPHYFGYATVGNVIPDINNERNSYCTIEGLFHFNEAVLARNRDEYIETIPPNLATNYWRNGVRPITNEIYQQIVNRAGYELVEFPGFEENASLADEMESFEEGNQRHRYTTYFERNPALRARAVEVHGTTCRACQFNFGSTFGEWGEGYIHVHHLKPMAGVRALTLVNPLTDLCVLCANCHSMVHRFRNRTLSIDELIELLIINR
jgi:predicted HNH restriction endonuclease